MHFCTITKEQFINLNQKILISGFCFTVIFFVKEEEHSYISVTVSVTSKVLSPQPNAVLNLWFGLGIVDSVVPSPKFQRYVKFPVPVLLFVNFTLSPEQILLSKSKSTIGGSIICILIVLLINLLSPSLSFTSISS